MRLALLPLAALLGCSGASEPAGADPATVLLEFVSVHYDDVMIDIRHGVLEDVVDTMEDDLGAYRAAELGVSGDLRLPDDVVDEPRTDGEVAIAWSVTYLELAFDEDEPDGDGIRHWYWSMDEEIERLALPTATVSGSGYWEVEEERWDYVIYRHTWMGMLSIDGADPVSVAWRLPNGEEDFDGTIDNVEVEWEGSNPAGI